MKQKGFSDQQIARYTGECAGRADAPHCEGFRWLQDGRCHVGRLRFRFAGLRLPQSFPCAPQPEQPMFDTLWPPLLLYCHKHDTCC